MKQAMICMLFCSTLFSCISDVQAETVDSLNVVGVEQPVKSEHQAGDIWIEPWTGMEFVWVPGSCFQMGTPKGGSFTPVNKQQASLLGDNFLVSILKVASVFIPVGCSSMQSSMPADFDQYTLDERPVHTVCLQGFWIGKYEVTQGQWSTVMGTNPSYFKSGADYPVEQVSWDQTNQFIAKLNGKAEGGFALPSEAQWEFAARSGGKVQRYSGADQADAVAWYFANSGNKTHAVGTKRANGLGIYDMSGNLREWCRDMYAKDAYSKHSLHEPLYISQDEKEQFSRAIRGGSYYLNACDVRCTSRTWSWKEHSEVDVGFRLIKKD